MSEPTNTDTNTTKGWLVIAGGFAGGIAASTCCILPLVLFSLGISGAWIGNLTDMAEYQLYFVILSFAFLAAGYYYVYFRKEDCEDGEACAHPLPNRFMKVALWGATVLVIIASLFPHVAPYFMEG